MLNFTFHILFATLICITRYLSYSYFVSVHLIFLFRRRRQADFEESFWTSIELKEVDMPNIFMYMNDRTIY